MRKLTKKISMLMVLAMLVGLFSGVVSASAASAWSFKSGKYNVAVGGEINMKKNEYADFDLLKDGKAPEGYTVVWESSDEDVVWVNAKTGQLRADKAKKAEDGDKAVISATFTNTKTKKSATRSFTIVVGEVKAPVYTVEQADVTAVLGDAIKFAPVVKNEAGEVVKFATHKSYNGYFLDGKAITNPWTPEAAGEYTVTVAQFASKADVADLAKAVRKDEVKVTVKAELAAEATGLKEITVYGDFAKDAKFTVVKDGTVKISATATVAEDGKSAILALTNRISKGLYTVTCGDVNAEFIAEDERVESIVIVEKDGQIFTNAARDEAYAHYDVFNQYGESIRKSADVKFTSSADRSGYTCDEDTQTGVVTIKTNAAVAPFNYSNIVVLTAVVSNYNGFAKSETATLTIGLQNNIGSIKVKGVILEDTTELLEAVPAEFVGGDYYMVFEAYDRNGNLMKFDPVQAYDDLTFVSVSPLLISDIDKTSAIANTMKSVYIDGVEYGAVKLVEGQSVKQGGVADIKVTSKSGGTTDVQVRVLCNQILKSFRVIQPEGVVSVMQPSGWNNDGLVLGYEALDTEGEKITNFRALVGAVAFSDPNVKMVENADGSATLKANVSGVPATKEVDGQFVFSVILPAAAKAENVTIKVKAGRYADSIGAYTGTTEILEGDYIDLGIANNSNGNWDAMIDFYDQYDEKIGSDNGAAAFGVGTKIGVQVIAGKIDIINKTPNAVTGSVEKDYYLYNGGENIQIQARHGVETFEDAVIEVVIFDHSGSEIKKNAEKRFALKVVDLSQVVSFSTEPAWNGADQYRLENGVEETNGFIVKGYLANGHKVDVPLAGTVTGASYVTFSAASYCEYGNIYTATTAGKAVTGSGVGIKVDPNFAVITTSEPIGGADNIYFLDQSRKDIKGNPVVINRTVNVEAKIYVFDGVNLNYKATASTAVNVGVYKRDVESINFKTWGLGNIHDFDTNAKTAKIHATNGVITYTDLLPVIGGIADNYGEGVNYADTWAKNDAGAWVAKTATATELMEDLTITITNFKEGDKGLDVNNGKVVNNDQAIRKSKYVDEESKTQHDYKKTNVDMIQGTEIGDTFTATYKCGNVSVSVDFTVTSDTSAWFSGITDDPTWK